MVQDGHAVPGDDAWKAERGCAVDTKCFFDHGIEAGAWSVF
jgi:hypothetical protein